MNSCSDDEILLSSISSVFNYLREIDYMNPDNNDHCQVLMKMCIRVTKRNRNAKFPSQCFSREDFGIICKIATSNDLVELSMQKIALKLISRLWTGNQRFDKSKFVEQSPNIVGDLFRLIEFCIDKKTGSNSVAYSFLILSDLILFSPELAEVIVGYFDIDDMRSYLEDFPNIYALFLCNIVYQKIGGNFVLHIVDIAFESIKSMLPSKVYNKIDISALSSYLKTLQKSFEYKEATEKLLSYNFFDSFINILLSHHTLNHECVVLCKIIAELVPDLSCGINIPQIIENLCCLLQSEREPMDGKVKLDLGEHIRYSSLSRDISISCSEYSLEAIAILASNPNYVGQIVDCFGDILIDTMYSCSKTQIKYLFNKVILNVALNFPDFAILHDSRIFEMQIMFLSAEEEAECSLDFLLSIEKHLNTNYQNFQQLLNSIPEIENLTRNNELTDISEKAQKLLMLIRKC